MPQMWFFHLHNYHYIISIIYITIYTILVFLVSFCVQWRIKRVLSSEQASKDHELNLKLSVDLEAVHDTNPITDTDTERVHLHKLSTIDRGALESAICSSPSSAKQVFFHEETLKKQSIAAAWCYSFVRMRNIYRDIFIELSCKTLQIGVIFKLLIIYANHISVDHEDHDLVEIILCISALIHIIYKLITCITIYVLSHQYVDIILELFNLTFSRCLYVNYRLYTQETCAPQKFFHLLHSSLKTSSLLLLYLVLLLRSNDDNIRYDPFIISCISVSFISLLSSIISNDTNIMKAHWKQSRLNLKTIIRGLLWRFSEITHRILLFLLLYNEFGLNVFVIILAVEYALCFVLFCYNHSVLVLGSIFFYHVTAGKYFGGRHSTQRFGYYIFVLFSIYRFLSSFIYLIVLSVYHFISLTQRTKIANIALIYEWCTFILWILCMFYVTEKGTRAVYNDQLLAPLAIYQQFVQLLDFIVFGASIEDLVQHRYDDDDKNIIQYLCSTSNKVTMHSQERLDIIRNILFGKQHQEVYKEFLVEQNDQHQMCIHHAVTANQLNILKFFTEACSVDINVLDDNDQTCLHIAIERCYLQIIRYLLACRKLDITVKDAMHRSYLHFAAMSQSIEIIKCFDFVMKKENASISCHDTDDFGKTMLFYVDVQTLIEYLIQNYKLDVHAIDFDGKTVLFHSINEKKFKLTKYFIEECDVDIHIQDNNGTLAFFYAQSIEMADYMMHTCNMDCNIVDNNGHSVIFNAVAKHYSNELCTYYIETCDANIEHKDKYNRSLVDIAVEHLNITQVQYLLHRNPVDIQQQMHSDRDIRIKTWCCAKDKLISSLYELFQIDGYGIDNILNVVNKNGNKHNIHYVIQSMWYVKEDDELHDFGIEMLQNMIKRNRQLVDIADDDHNTPIFYCIDTEIYELVVIFVEKGADLYHTNAFREAPLEYAIKKCKSNDIREYLMETKYNSPHVARLSYHHDMKSVTALEIGQNESVDHDAVHIIQQASVEMEHDKNDDLPQVLLQKTIEYLANDTKRNSEEVEDVDQILDDIDMDHVVGLLNNEDNIHKVIVEKTPVPLEKIEVVVVEISSDEKEDTLSNIASVPTLRDIDDKVIEIEETNETYDSLDGSLDIDAMVATMTEVLHEAQSDTDIEQTNSNNVDHDNEESIHQDIKETDHNNTVDLNKTPKENEPTSDDDEPIDITYNV